MFLLMPVLMVLPTGVSAAGLFPPRVSVQDQDEDQTQVVDQDQDRSQNQVVDQDQDPEADPPVLQLRTALEIGISENFQMRIARNQLKVAQNNQTLGNAGFLPVIDATTTLNERVEDSEFSAGGNERTTEGARSSTRNASVQARWVIFDGLRMFYERDQLIESEEAADLAFQLQMETLVADIIVSYYDLVRIGRLTENLRNNVETSEERIRIEETKVDLGSGSQADLLQARSDLNADRSAYLRERNRLEQAKIAFNTLLARTHQTSFAPTDSIPLDDALRRTDLLQQWETGNKALQLALRNVRISRIERRKIAAERLPEITLNSGYSFNRSENDGGFISFNESTGLSAGVTARIPIFNGFQLNRRIQNADIALQNSQLEAEAVRMQLDAEFETLYRAYMNQLELVELEEENLIHAEASLDIAVERFRLGTISPLEFREAQQTLLSAENRLIQARFDAKAAETELLLLSGLLI